MTIIAYDGKTVASDRQMTDSGMRALAQKIFRLESGDVVAITGDFSISLALKSWYESGKPEGKCPCHNEKENFGHIVVFKPDGSAEEYENCETPIPVLDPFMAWGSGRNYAMAALGMGMSAQEAVEMASRFDVFCGLGVDVVLLTSVVREISPCNDDDLAEINKDRIVKWKIVPKQTQYDPYVDPE